MNSVACRTQQYCVPMVVPAPIRTRTRPAPVCQVSTIGQTVRRGPVPTIALTMLSVHWLMTTCIVHVSVHLKVLDVRHLCSNAMMVTV